MFELNDDRPIVAYVNAPVKILSFKEVCSPRGCETGILYIGIDHTMEYSEDEEVRFIFENDSATDQIFQIAYIDATYDLIWGAASPSFMLSTIAFVCLTLANLV